MHNTGTITVARDLLADPGRRCRIPDTFRSPATAAVNQGILENAGFINILPTRSSE